MSAWLTTLGARVRVRADGVAEVRHAPGAHHTREVAEGQVRAFADLLEGRRTPLLVFVPEGFRLEDGAREYLTRSPEVGRTFSRGALVFDRKVASVAVNVFLRVRRPVVPMKAFSAEAEALAWLSR